MIIIYDDGDLKPERLETPLEAISLYDIDDKTWCGRERLHRSWTDVVLFRRKGRYRLFKSQNFPTIDEPNSREFTQEELDAIEPEPCRAGVSATK